MTELIVVISGIIVGFLVYQLLDFLFDKVKRDQQLRHVRKTLQLTFDQIDRNNKEFKVLREEINECYKEKITKINTAKEDELKQIEIETNRKLKELDNAIAND